MAQSKPKSATLRLDSDSASLRIYAVGNEWTALGYTLSISEARIYNVRSGHGSDVVSLLDFLYTSFPTSSDIAGQPTCSSKASRSGKRRTRSA